MKKNKILHIFLTIALVFVMFPPAAVKAETTYRVIAPNGSSTTEASFRSAGGTYSLVVITSDNSVWTAKPSAGWITTSKQTGRASDPTVDIIVSQNRTMNVRTGYVDFVSGTATYRFSVTQSSDYVGDISNFNVISPTKESTTSYCFGYNGGSYNLVVVTTDNATWTATTSASWITTSKKTGSGSNPQVTISVAQNNKRESRSGKVSFSTSKGTYVFYITQSGNPYAPEETEEPVDIFIQKSSLEVSYNAQTTFIGAGSNYAWTATSDCDWIYFYGNTNHGTAGQTMGMYIAIDENTTNRSRVGHIIVRSCNESKTITITQAAK